jgi:hypothetical protein
MSRPRRRTNNDASERDWTNPIVVTWPTKRVNHALGAWRRPYRDLDSRHT